jgi:hypothetical protein
VAGNTYARFRFSTDSSASFNINTPNGAATNGEVEDYQLTITQAYDYGDAPDTSNTTTAGDYQTTTTRSGANAPSHAIVNGLSLGATIDEDDGTLQNITATADDTDGTDDEDGVTFSSTTIRTDDANYSVTVNVTNTENRNVKLIGWIDFDRSGTFDSDEAVSTSGFSNLSGNQTLTWSSLPSDITNGTTYARFRLSSDTDLTTSFATGTLDDGEIEDYQLTLQGIDYGDAPDTSSNTSAGNYQTRKSDGGASHIISSNLTLGSSVDADTGSLQNSAATADDTNGTDDETAITTFPTLSSGATSYSISNISITNTTGSNATLIGWIDFNRNGQFEATEAAITTVANNAISANLNWLTLTGVTGGSTYARFRLSTDTDLITSFSTGELDDGEVEDYQINIAGGTDYGDAPDSGAGTGTGNYETTDKTGTIDDGPSHTIVSSYSIGSTVDQDSGNLQDSTATADDTNGTDDEDGVTFVDTTVISKNDSDDSYSVEVVVNAPDEVTTTAIASDDFSSGGYTGGSGWSGNWQENNDDGVDTTGNTRVTSNALQIGQELDSAQRSLTLPTFNSREDVVLSFDHSITGTGINPADNPLAIQISTNGGTSFTNVAAISSSSTTSTNYSVDLTNYITSGGNAIIRFLFTNNNLVTPTNAYSIDNITVNKETPVDTTLVGWIDFNRNGNFEATEAVSKSTSNSTLVTDGTTANTLTWTGINSKTASTLTGDTYARFRLSTDPLLNTSYSTGAANNGEVEDYQLNIKNTITGNGRSENLTNSTAGVDDLFIGGAGQDTLTGNGGNDCFKFNRTSDGIDIITDFNSGDKIDFSSIFATGGELAGINNPFGTYVETLVAGGGTLIQIDFNDDGNTTYNKNVVYLENYTAAMTAADFIF